MRKALAALALCLCTVALAEPFDDGDEERGIEAEEFWSTLKSRFRPLLAGRADSCRKAQ